jgi:hypothetical protein
MNIFRELRNRFSGKKCIYYDADPESFRPWIRDGEILDPGSWINPGSATLYTK